MLKIKNKFIIFIILMILGIITSLFVSSYINKSKNLYSYVILINGEAKLNNNPMFLKEKNKLVEGDSIQTIGNNSLVVLEWGDGSVTRLGGNTSIEIGELHVLNDLSKINIKFNLLNGKTWSNIVSFFGEGSYFKEYFRDSEAAVRGTVFNVDLDNDYLYVINHKVDLTRNNGEIITVNEQEPLDLKSLTFISLESFIKSIKDKGFDKINTQLDNELLNILRQRLTRDLANINKLNNIDFQAVLGDDVKKTELYVKLLTDYQKLNFIKPDDQELFRIKLEFKDKLLQLSDGENKSMLVNSTLYDFKEIIDAKKYESVDLLLTILANNKGSLLEFNLSDYLKSKVVPEEIKTKITDKFSELKDFFQSSFSTIKSTNISIEDIKNFEEKADTKVKEVLDGISDKLINK